MTESYILVDFCDNDPEAVFHVFGPQGGRSDPCVWHSLEKAQQGLKDYEEEGYENLKIYRLVPAPSFNLWAATFFVDGDPNVPATKEQIEGAFPDIKLEEEIDPEGCPGWWHISADWLNQATTRGDDENIDFFGGLELVRHNPKLYPEAITLCIEMP